MKKILSMLSVLTLAGTTVGSVNLNNNTKINNFDEVQDYKEIVVASPKNILLTTAGDTGTIRKEWAYTTINLGAIRPWQIYDIFSTKKDSYTEHKVESYGYYTADYNAGIHCSDFETNLYSGAVNGSWDYTDAVARAEQNFESWAKDGLANHFAKGTIKFQWYFNQADDLLIDIVGTLHVGAFLSTVKGVASIKLGVLHLQLNIGDNWYRE